MIPTPPCAAPAAARHNRAMASLWAGPRERPKTRLTGPAPRKPYTGGSSDFSHDARGGNRDAEIAFYHSHFGAAVVACRFLQPSRPVSIFLARGIRRLSWVYLTS